MSPDSHQVAPGFRAVPLGSLAPTGERVGVRGKSVAGISILIINNQLLIINECLRGIEPPGPRGRPRSIKLDLILKGGTHGTIAGSKPTLRETKILP